MFEFGLPVLATLFVWWFSTGVIIWLDNLPPRTFGRSMAGASFLLIAALYGLAASAADTSVAGAYCAFTSAVLVWGWLEMAFLMGFITGTAASGQARASGWRHFFQAIGAILHHELSLIAAAAVVVALTWGQPNQVGTWTFVILWGMRSSAKLNLFLGVRNLSLELLPAHLRHLSRFLTVRPMNLLFPISVTVSTIIAVLLVQAAATPGADPAQVAGFTMLATLMALAVLEHWFLMLPLPVNTLWQWALSAREARTANGPVSPPRPQRRAAVLPENAA